MIELILKRKRQFLIYTLACLTPIINDFLTMFFLAAVFDVFQKENIVLFKYTIAMGVFIAILSSVMYLISRYLRISYMRDTLLDVRLKAFNKIYSFSYQEFHQKSKDTYISNLTNDINMIEQNFFLSLINIIYNLGKYVLVLVILLAYDFKFGLVVFAISLAMYFLIHFFEKKTTELQNDVSIQNEQFITHVSNNFNGLEIIKLNNLSSLFQNKTIKQLKQLENKKIKYNIFNDLQGGLVEAISIIIIIGLILYQIQAMDENTSLGTVVFMFQLSNSMIFSLTSFLRFINQFKASLTIFDKIAKVNNKDQDLIYGQYDFSLKQNISINQLSFQYDTKMIIQDASFVIEKGKKYLIKGTSGSGKTTLLHILAKMVEDYSGHIEIDGIDLKEINSQSFNNQIAYIDQDVFLFEDSVLNNVTLFKEMDQDRINYALEQSGLHDELSLQLLLHENGKNISGGQRQRISIARALAKEVEIIFVDECTSSLNEELGASIEQALLHLDCTVIAVSHRYYEGVTNNYDYVIEIKNGEVTISEAANYFKEVIVC